MDTSGGVNAEKIISPRQPVLDVGKTLREAREVMGLSVHDIANRIKFAPRQVEALEANDFSNLPQATFLRGFVRSYARVLQLDEVALIAALPGDPAAQIVSKAQVVDVAFPTSLSLQRFNLLWLGGALGVAMLLGLFMFTRGSESTVKPGEVVVESVPLPPADSAASAVAETKEQPVTEEVDKVVVPRKVPEQVAPQKMPDAVVSKKMPDAVVANKTPETVIPKKADEPVVVKKMPEPVVPYKLPEPAVSFKLPEPVKAEPVVTPAPHITAASAPVAVVKPDIPMESLMRRPLHFIFREAMWAEVIDARGAVLLSRNVPRGSEKWIGGPGRAPYNISVSNPRKVKLYYKGNLVDLSAYPATEMAHLQVK
jgi:cytoskeleton protein RodZ